MSINLNKTTNNDGIFNEFNYTDNSSFFDNNNLGIDTIEELGLNSTLLDNPFVSAASDETLPVELQNLFAQEFGMDNPFESHFQAPGPLGHAQCSNAVVNIEELNTEGMLDGLPADFNNKQANLNSTEMPASIPVHSVKKRKTRIKIIDSSFKFTKTNNELDVKFNETGHIIKIKDIEYLITRLDPKYIKISNYFFKHLLPFYHENKITLLHIRELSKKDIVNFRYLFNNQSDEEKKSWKFFFPNHQYTYEFIEKEYAKIMREECFMVDKTFNQLNVNRLFLSEGSLKSFPIELQNRFTQELTHPNREENQMDLPFQMLDNAQSSNLEMNLEEMQDLPPGIENHFVSNSELVDSTSIEMQASHQNLHNTMKEKNSTITAPMIQHIEKGGRNYCIAVQEVENLIANLVTNNSEIANYFHGSLLPFYYKKSIPFINFKNLNVMGLSNLMYLLDNQPKLTQKQDIKKRSRLYAQITTQLDKLKFASASRIKMS